MNEGKSRGIQGTFGGADDGAGEATNAVSRATEIIQEPGQEKERVQELYEKLTELDEEEEKRHIQKLRRT